MDVPLLVCADCGTRFEFSVEERQHFLARGFQPPKRCKSCRAAKRKRGPERRDDRRAEPKAERPPPTMHPATCTVCGAATEVPFVPDGARPVYCLPCLKQRTR